MLEAKTMDEEDESDGDSVVVLDVVLVEVGSEDGAVAVVELEPNAT